MKIVKRSKTTDYSIREEDGIYYIFADDDHILATPGGNSVCTLFKPIALRLLADLEKYGYLYTDVVSLLSWHFTTIDNFANLGKERVIEILDDSFLKQFDWTLHCPSPDPYFYMDWTSVFGPPDKVPQELRTWLEGLTIMQLSAACCIANAYESLNISYLFSLLVDKTEPEKFNETAKGLIDFLIKVMPISSTKKEIMKDIKTFKLYYEQDKEA